MSSTSRRWAPRLRNGHSAPGAALGSQNPGWLQGTTSKLWPLRPSADRRPLPQLKGGDAEYPLQPQRRDRACIHACRLEHRREPQVLGQRNRVAVKAWNVEEDLAAAHAGQQSRQNHLGGGAVAGHQWADLVALLAWTDHAPAGELSVAHECATDMPGRA